jgi:DNA-binding FadR family transcriptional regulator
MRRFRDVVGDAGRDREERFAAMHELFVVLADMTRNRVWQILARRIRALFRQASLRAVRGRMRRDPSRFVPLVDACLDALETGCRADAAVGFQELIQLLGDFSDIRQPARKGVTR